ncbi:MAG TPA: cytochrome c family protein [Candidatus Polarisedimenticolia bacterium]|nr:cytochrome c family protein [Candidatus Polarisedimenticolia bacterium]
MRRSIGQFALGCGILLLLAARGAAAADVPAHNYVGADKCKMCHNSPAKGAQYTKWAESKHSKAFATLASEEAKKVAAAKGIADPQKAPECLRCHVSGSGAPAEKLTDKYKAQDGVSCEGCHGPGGDYWQMAVMKDQAKAVAAGLVIPSEATCKECHNADGPTFKGFDFASMKAKIAHPNPAKAGAK